MYATVAISFPGEGVQTSHVQFPHETWQAMRAALAERLGIDISAINVGNVSALPNPFFAYVDWESLAPLAPGRGPGSPAPIMPDPYPDPYPVAPPIVRPPGITDPLPGPPIGFPPSGISPIGGVVALSFAWLVTRLGAGMARIVWFALRKVAGAGGRVSYAAIPRWVKVILEGLGVAFAVDLVLGDDGPDDETPEETVPPPTEIVPAPPGGVVVGPLPPEIASRVTRSWTANGTPFIGLTDGRVCAMNKRGRWRCWWPKKPIVLYADGSANLKHFLKGDKALNKQAKAIASALARRAPKTRVVCGKCRRVTCICK